MTDPRSDAPPMQPMYRDDHGVVRFRANPLVRWLLDNGGKDLNDLALQADAQGWSDEDRQQFAQLIGYSLSGYSELHYVTDEAYARAERAADAPSSVQGKANELVRLKKELEDSQADIRAAAREGDAR
jgi:hypothetical protein